MNQCSLYVPFLHQKKTLLHTRSFAQLSSSSRKQKWSMFTIWTFSGRFSQILINKNYVDWTFPGAFPIDEFAIVSLPFPFSAPPLYKYIHTNIRSDLERRMGKSECCSGNIQLKELLLLYFTVTNVTSFPPNRTDARNNAVNSNVFSFFVVAVVRSTAIHNFFYVGSLLSSS